MTQQELNPLTLSQDTKSNQEKLIKVEVEISDLTKQILNKDIEVIESQSNKIEKLATGITAIRSKVASLKQNCQINIEQIQREVTDLQSRIAMYEKDFVTSNKEKDFRKKIQDGQKQYLNQWQKRIKISATIDVEKLVKVEIQDRKSKANELFKWIIVAIYGQAQTKYYFPNFKQQVFDKDEGKDFKQRLGKINASNAKEDQRLKTVQFLKLYPQIKGSRQLKNVQDQIEDIKSIAQIFNNCYEMAKKIRQYESAIEKSKQQSRSKDEEAMKWKSKSDALKDRIKINHDYLNILTKIETGISGKAESYKQKQNMAKEIVQKLKRSENIPQLTIDIENDKRDACECKIF